MAVASGARPPRAPDPVHVLRGHRTDITALAFPSQANCLLSGDADGEVKLWDLGVRRALSYVRAHTASAGVIGLIASRLDPSTFLSQGRDGVVKVWTIAEGAIARQPVLVIETGSYNFCKLALAEARSLQSFGGMHQIGAQLLSSGEEHGANWSQGGARATGTTEPCRQTAAPPSDQGSTVFEHQSRENDGKHETGSLSGNGDESRGNQEGSSHRGLSAALESRGAGLAAGLQSDGQGSTAAGARSSGEGGSDAGASSGGPVRPAADAAQQLVAVAGADPSTVEIWDVRNGQRVQRLEQPRSGDSVGGLQTDSSSAGMCMSVQLLLQPESAPSPSVVGGYEDGSLLAWDLRAPSEPCIRQRLHSEPVLSLAVDQSGSGGVSGSADDKVVFFNLRYGEGRCTVVKEIPLGRPGIGDVALRDDERIVATAGWDHRVRIFDYKRRTPLAVLRYHSAAVTSVSFSPGGHLLASAGRDAAIALWSIYPPKVPGIDS